ncbi:nucleotidyltransferase family protein [Novosphingobium sp. M1R2S20]|uniref:NTP transferase domain-containing protein n=1 Tax=Novosphingobium rhizovicinum TaxID=3228928 RepID=A0ABV3R8K9_9SPHN
MKLAAVVLAAGSATRFGSDKLSAPFHGEPLVFHAIRAARAAPVEKVVIVAHPALNIGVWAGEPCTEVVRMTSDGLSISLRAGLSASGEVDGLFVFLGDMPLVPHNAAQRLAEKIGDHYAALPRYHGTPGHPVLLSCRAFADVLTLTGDAGAAKLLRARSDVLFDDCPNPLIHLDVDRPEDLGWLARRGREEEE